MLDLLEIFRIRYGGKPLLVSIAVLALLLAGFWRRGFHTSGPAWMRRASWAIGGVGLLGLLAYVSLAIWYASDEHFYDNAEPTVPAVSWLFHLGQPLYHAPDAAERYAHIWGPMSFVSHAAAFALLGPGIGVSKGLGAAAGIVSLAFILATLRRHGSALRAASLTGVSALLLLAFRHYSFWTRPDPLQLLCVSVALFVAVSGRGYASAIFLGLASGVLWNLKFTGPLYSLPVFAIAYHRLGLGMTALAGAIGLAVAVMPFVVFSNVSFTNYMTWVGLSANTGLVPGLLRQNIDWACYLAAPLLLSYYAVARDRRPVGSEWRAVILACIAGACGVVIAGAKPGAGPYHLMPFLPVVIYIVSWQADNLSQTETIHPVVPRACVAFVLVAIAVALAQQAHFVTTMAARRTLGEGDDIRQFAGTHPGIVAMGYGRTEALTLARPILVFRNGSYLIDQPAVREHQLAGLEVPQATIDALAHCRVNYWLIPKGEPPFSMVNAYTSVLMRPLYPPEFRQVFEATHARVGETMYYDVWRCRGNLIAIDRGY